jgi:hypothetical protein
MYKKTKLHGLSPRANYTDRATAAFRRSDCQLLRIDINRSDPYSRILGFIDIAAIFLSRSSSVLLTRLNVPRSRPTTFFFILVVPGIEPRHPDQYPRTLTTSPQRRSE